jgi:hypothetical protein
VSRRRTSALRAIPVEPPPPPTGRAKYFGEQSPMFCRFVGDAARHILRGFKLAGIEVVGRARSAHGSDCDCRAEHLSGPMGSCRCIRVVRLRVSGSGDWLLVFGDMAESNTVRLQGPYTYDAALSYGGGFWVKVSL